MLLRFLDRRRNNAASLRDSRQSRKMSSQPRSAVFDLTDDEVKGTMRQIVELTVQVARAMGMCDEEIGNLRLGAFLHDIGMVGIPDDVLFKSGPLTKQEREIVCRHPTYAHELLSAEKTLSAALDIPYCHHEKWDGTGYPRGLKQEEIPLAARIFAVVDVWVALRSDRPYRPAWTTEDAQVYILQRAGRDFDPAVVDAFIALQPEPDI